MESIKNVFKAMKRDAKRGHLEKLEVVKINSTDMRRDKRKKKYLSLVKAIRETKGTRSGRMGAMQDKHLQKKKKMLEKYL